MVDIVRDILDRLLMAAATDELTPTFASQLEAQIRHSWGGARVYIAKHGEPADRLIRDLAMRNDWGRGVAVGTLSARYRVKPRRVRQILRGR